MIREVFPNIYVNEIPLPKNPLKILNSYIILSEDRAMIIDTGFNLPECKEALLQGVKELNIDLTKTDVVLTHMHVDHSGLADLLWGLGSKVYIGEKDGKLLDNFRTSPEGVLLQISKAFNLAKEILDMERNEFDIVPKELFDYTSLKEGETLQIGDYIFEIIDIPGHTPGHIGLYEKKHKLFFGGDLILNEVTPNITYWNDELDSLGAFLASLKKIEEMDIEVVFSAHRSKVTNYRQRIKEIVAHHEGRLQEIKTILQPRKRTVIETASLMHWDLKYDDWDKFPLAQKWFAAGEAMSHLEHLVFLGEVERVREDNETYYLLK